MALKSWKMRKSDVFRLDYIHLRCWRLSAAGDPMLEGPQDIASRAFPVAHGMGNSTRGGGQIAGEPNIRRLL